MSYDLKSVYHYVVGPVYIPLQIDSDGESMTADDIKTMAHDFVSQGLIDKIDVMHDKVPSGAKVVESWIAAKDDPYGFPEGTWMLGVKVPEGELWDQIKGGELNGYSFHALVKKVARRVLVDIAKIVQGETENSDVDSVPVHYHQYYCEFNSDGRVTFGVTDSFELEGQNSQSKHNHMILGTVVTEESAGHTHRFVS